MALSNEEWSSQVTTIIGYLDFTNTPKGVLDAYRTALNGAESSLERIFLDNGGFPTWFAYFLAKRAANRTTHFAGQAALKQVIDSLPELSLDDLRTLVLELKAGIPPSSLEKIQTVHTSLQNSTTSHPYAKKRRTTAENVSSRLVMDHSRASSSHEITESETTHSARFDLQNAAIPRIIDVFPTYLAEAIRTYPLYSYSTWAGAVTMTFLDVSSGENKIGSMMSLEVTRNKVEHLARELFDAHIESTDMHRYVLLSTGLRITPAPEIVLRGCKRQVIFETFGPDIYNAIIASPAYREEVERGKSLTQSVTMTLSNNTEEGAVINVSLDEKEGVRVRGKLYE